MGYIHTNQYGKDEVKKIIFVFLKLYAEAIQQNDKMALDIITAFIKGHPENQETENLSSVTEFLRLNTETKKMMRQAKNVVTIGDQKNLGSAIINTYSKGIELVSKILTTCILLMQISIKEDIKLLEINSLPLGKKIEKFKKISVGKYDIIVDLLDKEIRNADAHLDIRFDRGSFVYKVRYNKEIKIKKISINDFLLKKYWVVGWISQAFIYSVILLILAGTSPEKYKVKIKEIFLY